MGIISSPEQSSGIFGAIKGALGLFDNTNKTDGLEEKNLQPIDEYESKMTDTEILELSAQWKRTYETYYEPIKKTQELAFDYWVGKHRTEDGSQIGKNVPDAIDNLMFESIETFLPIATRANPDPLVSGDETPAGQQMQHDLKIGLVHEADIQKLRRKLAKMTRHWVLYRIGAGKLSWDIHTKSIKTDIINPKRMIFDKDGYIDEGGNFIGEYLGEKKSASAKVLTEMFPKKAEYIKEKARSKMGTKLDYIEWWYRNTDVFYVLDSEVLGKYKNPNWNYDGEQTEIDPTTGEKAVTITQGINHFKSPKAPYIFLAIFNTGLQPHDETSLVIQNISIQDMINRRWRQIDKNVDGMNNGMVVSGTAFTEEQASQAASALRRGVAIRVPNGKVGDAVQRFPAPNLPADVFNNLKDARNELKNIFGTSGSSAEGVKSQETVRGKIMINQMDSSRIGGGVTEYIEQVADTWYNWIVQMMFVYYDDEHFITSSGAVGGTELITLKNDRFPLLKTLNVTVKEGSLIPKDPLTQRNEAIDLWSASAIDPRTLYKKLDYPDPNEATKQLLLWQLVQKGTLPPQAYIPDFSVPPQVLPPPQGVGSQAVNTLGQGQPEAGQTPPPQTSPEAVNAQSKQLIQSVPIK